MIKETVTHDTVIHREILNQRETWSSLTSTQRMENGGSKWAKPSSGAFEQLVTNYRHKADCTPVKNSDSSVKIRNKVTEYKVKLKI